MKERIIKVELQERRKEGEGLKEFFDRFFQRFYKEIYEKNYNNAHYFLLDPLNAESRGSESLEVLLDKYKELEYCNINVSVEHSDEEIKVFYEEDHCNQEFESVFVRINEREILFEAEHDLGLTVC